MTSDKGIDELGSRLLREAWDLAATSLGRVYYSYSTLAGERPWRDRWEMLSAATDVRGRDVVELGSNMGLVSTFALLDGARSAVACDRDEIVLRAGQLAATAFGVFPTFVPCDMAHTPGWEEQVAPGRCDLLYLLNVLRWVDDSARVLRFCSRFEEVVVEDHDDAAIARARLVGIGFDDVEVVGESELGRPLLVARRSSSGR